MGKTLFGSLATAGRGLINRSPVPYVSHGNIQIPWRQPAGAEAQMQAMGSVGTLFAIVNRTSNATALVNWRLYRKAPSGLKEDRVEVTSHAALDLINRPNPFFTRQELVESTQQHIDLTGEGWWVITRNPRSPIPLELWPVRPDRMSPVPDPVNFIAGYVYTAPDGRQIPLKVEDVIQIRMPNPLDPYRGLGPVQSILTEIDASRYSAEWNRNFFLNSAEPGGIIEVEKHLTDTEFDEMRDRWAEQHKGVSNAHRVAIIENGMKWVDRKLTQRDMQFAELRQVSRDVMREAFGAPAFVLGEVGDVNRATAEASKVLFAEQLTVPRLERFKGALNNDLLPLYGKDAARALEFDYDDPVPADADARNAEMKAKAETAKIYVDMGFEPKSVADALGLPEMEVMAAAGGDGLATPQQLGDTIQSIYLGVDTVITWEEAREILNRAGANLDLSVKPPATIRRFSRGGGGAAAEDAAAPAAPVPAARLDLHHHVPYAPATRSLPSYNTVVARPRPLPRAAASDTDLSAVREQHEEALTALLEAWEPVAESQYDDLVQQIETAVDAADAEALAALAADSDAAARVLRTALADMAEAAATQMAAEAAEQGVKVRPPKLDKGLRNAFGSELVEIAAATAGLLAADTAASAGREALRLLVPGARGSEVAERVGSFLRGLKNWFRRDQLGGALHRAQNAGRVATLQAAPVARYFASEKNDANRCGPCGEIDGREFEDLTAAQAVYGAGGYQACEGGIRCRGTLTAVWETTEENAMGSTRRCWNTASPEEIAARGRALRPAVPAPGGEQTWYRISNSVDAGGAPTAAVHIYGDIGSWGITAASFVEELKGVDAAEIHLFVNSPGGEVFDGLAIHNALRSHRAKVMVQVDSLAASIASVIAMAGDRIIMSPHSQMMIHDAQGVSCGSPEELREYADFLDRQSDNIAAVYTERAGGTKLQWRKRMQAETWYFADEAVEAGLADEVGQLVRLEDETLDDRAMAAAWDLQVYNYAHQRREDAPAPELPAADGGVVGDAVTATVGEEPVCSGIDPAELVAAVARAQDPGPMPGFEADRFRDLMGSVAETAPAPPETEPPAPPVAAVEEPAAPDAAPEPEPPAVVMPDFDPAAFRVAARAAFDPMPGYDPDRFRGLMAGVAADAPAHPNATGPAPTPPPPVADARPVDHAPAPANEVAVDYFRTLLTNAAQDLAAPEQAAAPGPAPAEPIPAIDRLAFERSLREARL
ncbi:head maturation protease, ClpP-related [Streptomyces chartreusis]|uniref:head maturation protease, ClpP-related n=1 Tax=Streptomyces chartreusis TaxID=1969 RepID=UPI0033EBFEC9